MAGNIFLKPLAEGEAILVTVRVNLTRLADAAHTLGQEPLAQKLYRDADRIGVVIENLQLGRDQALRLYVEGAERGSKIMIETALSIAGQKSGTL